MSADQMSLVLYILGAVLMVFMLAVLLLLASMVIAKYIVDPFGEWLDKK